MANDMQWPSEDEDFDAVLDDNQSSGNQFTATKPKAVPAAPVAKKAPKSVAVSFSEPEETAAQPEAEDESFDEAIFDEPVQQHDEAAAQTHHDAPEATPEHEAVEHTAAPYEHVREPKKPRSMPTGVIRTVFEIALVLALAGVSYYAYTLHNDKQDLKTQVSTLNANPQLAIQKQTDDLITHVGQLMQLPADETPTVANVSDAVKAKQQSAFFTNAQNGDKVLMYVKAGTAILYRPSTDKIVLVAPLTFNNNATSTTAPATTSTTTTKR